MSSTVPIVPLSCEKNRLLISDFSPSATKGRSPEPLLHDLSVLWQEFLAGDLKPMDFQDELGQLFQHHDIQVSPRDLEKFTRSLGAATVDWHRARNAARVGVDLPPVTYSHYTPGPSGLNPGDPRTYAMAPNPGWKTLVAGATILASAPVWVPVVAEGASMAYSACLTNPVECIYFIKGSFQGILKGGWDMETGQLPEHHLELGAQKIFEVPFYLIDKKE